MAEVKQKDRSLWPQGPHLLKHEEGKKRREKEREILQNYYLLRQKYETDLLQIILCC